MHPSAKVHENYMYIIHLSCFSRLVIVKSRGRAQLWFHAADIGTSDGHEDSTEQVQRGGDLCLAPAVSAKGKRQKGKPMHDLCVCVDCFLLFVVRSLLFVS